ncbi:zinc finger protein ZXDC isoform X1 [Coregonus clupeaformis]|uniref:zinc finger protein ZXDC isoform X1 n=1 Tax=Coregonus clupeaformis TaxID=59861 RepID=UPI001E1C7B3B|nr:zinc finger protein ZXDC isoform X1 [Coregonus clupeaformis]
MHCCYRDTKMEIQGLSHAQNIHYQHGAPRRTGSSPIRTTTGACSLSISNENEAQEDLESYELQSDNNNHNRPRTSPFRLLAENGSVGLPVCKQNGKNNSPLQTQTANVGLRDKNTLKARELNAKLPPHDIFRTGYKYDIESGDNILQMALPFFAGEEEQYQQQQLQPPVLRQQHEDGAFLLQSLASEGTAACGSNSTANANKNTEEYYVVFNIVQEDGNDADKDRLGNPSKDGDTIRGKMKLEHSKIKTCNSMEVQSTNALIESDDNLNNLAAEALKRTVHLCSLLNSSSNSEATVTNEKQSVCYETENENTALTNEYGENICGHQVCVENIDSDAPNQISSQTEAQDSSALISENTDMVEMSDAMDFISDAGRSLSVSANADGTPNSASANETFSGTIMINNQSIIVTIENGILTLAAPPEGYTHKDDGMVGLKEHLGMKDHEDIVLLNYDSGTKSIGKISNVAVIRAGHHEQSRLGLSVSDSELALADNCSLSELGASLDMCPVIKQESGTLCAISEGDLVSQRPEGSSVDCDDNGDFQPVSVIGASGLSKKGALITTYRCPQPGCPSTFETRQKLKMHLLNHTEDQRPFKCPFEGCGWAFTTSYKLKRHLQSHDKVRPHKCEWEGCGRCFTTVYNLKAHVKQHDQENTFVCEICSERFRSATRLTNHQRAHFEPERPHKCEFPGCEKSFITYSALFSHNRTHFRETGLFICTYPGCDKRYDKACRIKIHMRSHTGERPFVCDSEACGWSFTSMSKLLRHKRKHDDDRRFTCPEEGCGKSFTRAEHLKGHSITHLGTKPFECHVDGCSAKFSARSSLYIHSKKHKQDAGSLRTRCPVANCSKHFSSCSSLKSHMLKHHHLNPDVLSQLEATPTLTPSSELVSAATTTGTVPGVTGGDQLAHLDLSSLFSAVPGGPSPTIHGVGVPVGATGPAGAFAMDLSLVSSGILTINPASVGSALCTSGHGATVAKASLDPLILAAGEDMVGGALPPRGTLNLDNVQKVTPEALGSLTVLTMQAASSSADHHTLSSSSALSTEPSPSNLAVPPGPELLSSHSKVAEAGGSRGVGRPLLGCVEVLGQQEGGKVLTQCVFPGHDGGSSFSLQKESELSHSSAVLPYSFLESSGSARTDYRAIQLAKKRKRRGPSVCSASSGLGQRKSKGGKASSTSAPTVPTSARFGEGSAAANGGLTIRDPVTGAQYVQIQLLQDDPASEGDLAFQLSSQPSSSHSQLTVDLPVNILQEPPAMTEDDNGSDNSQFTGSTINLQDLE